ncbi:MAG: serine/threonine protein kinase [Oscillospiraceae bacterium]|nr:serine/threonine protein kinase [Oscillospiraceae bacterium]
MTLEEATRLSYYREIAELNELHGVMMVQHIESKRVFVKKTLTTYDAGVFRYLQMYPIPHTPRIYEAIEDGGKLIVIEEYIDGTSLASYLNMRGTLTEQETVYIASQICEILNDFEKVYPPLVHRDIKPSNIILSDSMEVTLLDLDAAKHQNNVQYQDTQLIGTFGYAAPEQFGFGSSDIRTDIYALGVLMNVLLTSKFPQEFTVSGSLSQVITKCVQMDPKDRYQSAQELLLELQNGARKPTRIEKTDVHVEQTEKTQDQGWALPGFRGSNPFVKIFAFICYFLLFVGITNMRMDDKSITALRINQIFAFLSIMSAVLFAGNYRNAWRIFNVDKIKSRLGRWLAAAGIAMLIFYAWIAIMLVFERSLG